MREQFDLRFHLNDTRARVYLLWAIISMFGFVATHAYQYAFINAVWFVLSAIGIVYMWRVMPLRVKMMRQILVMWSVVIAVGMLVSVLLVSVQSAHIAQYSQFLGGFWLILLAVGYALNGLVDAPSGWYFVVAIINVVAALACYVVPVIQDVQYLVAAIISVWSMLMLWALRA